MLGLFMLIPVFTIYAIHLHAATPTLIGVALGCYGLSQGLLQIPFGMLSDRFGRKPILTLGLVLFASGSLWGALTHSIYGMILARTLQGTGAVGSVLIALLADLTPDEQRTRAMAVIGVTIGLSFSLAMVLSPTITHHFGLAGIFYLTTILAMLGLGLLHLVIPTPIKAPFHLDSEANPVLFKDVLTNRHLQRLNASIFSQHLILTSTFFAVPMLLQEQVKAGNLLQQWHFYLPLILIAFITMVPVIILAEKKHWVKTIFLLSVATTGTSQLILAFSYHHWLSICTLMFTYFVAFNILEATVPSLISKQASANSKGTAMGVYSSSQFLGIFAGGVLAGMLYQYAGIRGIFISNAIISLLWLLIATYIKPNAYQVTLIISVPNLQQPDALVEKLLNLAGVNEVISAPEEQVIYLRIDQSSYQNGSAHQLLDAHLVNQGN